MNLTVNIPDDLVGQLSAAGGDLSRRALEGFALEECYELDGFLKAHDVWIDYTLDDFRRELQDMKSLGF